MATDMVRADVVLHRSSVFLALTAPAIGAALLSGCAVVMKEPDRPTARERVALTYQRALTYLESARFNMTDAQKSVDGIDDFSRIAVGGGVAGAALNTLAKGRADVSLGFLAIGGTGYSIAQTGYLPTQRDIYGAGLNSLACIERTGHRVYQDSVGIREQLTLAQKTLSKAVAALSNELEGLVNEKRPEPEALLVAPKAREAETAGIKLQQSIREYLKATDVAYEMYFGVDNTVRQVNAQLRARAPSLDEIAKAGTILTTFTTAHTPIAADAQAAKNATQDLDLLAQNDTKHPVATKLENEMLSLRQAADAIKAMLPTGGYATTQLLESCQTLAPGQRPFRVNPSGAIKLTAGGDAYTLAVDSEQSVGGQFRGKEPSALQLLKSQPSDRTFSLAAPAGAKPNTYYFVVYENVKGGRELPAIEVNIVPPDSVDDTKKKPNSLSPLPPALTFTQKLSLLGLPNTIQSEKDPDFIARVQKLGNCVKLDASTGELTTALVKELKQREQANALGDCPALKIRSKPDPVAATDKGSPATTTPASAASERPPIPNPPSLDAKK